MSLRFQNRGGVARNECDAVPLAVFVGRVVPIPKNPRNMPCLHLDGKANTPTASWGLMGVHSAKHPVRARVGVGDDLMLTAAIGVQMKTPSLQSFPVEDDAAVHVHQIEVNTVSYLTVDRCR